VPRSRVVCETYRRHSVAPIAPDTQQMPAVLSRRGAGLVALGLGVLPLQADAAENQRASVFDQYLSSELRKWPGYTETVSGLQYLDVRIGEGTPAEVGKKVCPDLRRWVPVNTHMC